jgi:hypothetical protein
MVEIQRNEDLIKKEFKRILKNEFDFAFGMIGERSERKGSFYVEVEVQNHNKKIKAHILSETHFLVGSVRPIVTEVVLAQSDYFIDIFDTYKEVFLREGISNEELDEIGVTYVIRRAVGELAVAKFKKTTKYKMHCLYDDNFEKFFTLKDGSYDN